MALTKTQVSELYVAIFNRASEGEGNTYWQNLGKSDAETAEEMLATSDAQEYFGSSLDSNQAFIEHIYNNTLNKTIEDDAEGIAYWTGLLNDGMGRGEVVAGLIDAVYSYENSTDPATKAAYTQFTNRVEVSDFMADTVQETPSDYAESTSFDEDLAVDYTSSSVVAAMQSVVELDEGQIDAAINNVYTLKKNITESNSTQVVVTEGDTTVMWGDPDCDDCNVPATTFLQDILPTIVGSDLVHFDLDGIDINAETELSTVNFTVVDTDDADADTAAVQYELTTADGEQFTGEVAIAQSYVDFLNGLLFYTDPETGAEISRFTSVKADDTTATTTTYTFGLQANILTTEVNNGSTWETLNQYTSNENDLIVAGQTELIHGAYIDGGQGQNTLEIDAKGVYAQPLAILNVQDISIQNLPNVYDDYYDIGKKIVSVAADGTVTVTDTTTDSHADGLDIPDYQLDGSGDLENFNANPNSIIDLSRAIDIEKLTVTEGFGTGADLGELTVVGVRNGAELELNGQFTENVTVNYGRGMGDALELTLNLGDVNDTVFNIFSNSNTVNIDSIGGGNVLTDLNLGASTLLNMNVSGTAKLVISDDIKGLFTAGHPATIDASANLAGVDLTVGALDSASGTGYDDEVIFTGTMYADDHFTADGNGHKVVITGGEGHGEYNAQNGVLSIISAENGNNKIDVDGTVTSNVMVGNGNNVIGADTATSATIEAGNGNNTIDADNATNVSITTGNGNNAVTADSAVSATIMTGEGNDTIRSVESTSVTVDAGDGDNSVTVTASASMNITTGAGNDTVTVGGEGDAHAGNTPDNTAMVAIDLGAGTNTLVLGSDTDVASDTNGDDTLATSDIPGLTALAGSSITGSDITLDVNVDSNIANASVSGVVAVDLDGGADLTISAEQFIAIGATNFSVDGQEFGEKATLTIVVSESMNFDELGITDDTFICDNIDLNIVLACKTAAENVFTLTAEQLDMYIAPDGILVDTTDNYDNNQVVVTNASQTFDPFDATYGGGSIDDATNGTQDVTVIRELDGYDRPTEDDLSDTLTINSDVTPVADVDTTAGTVIIQGAADITATIDLDVNQHVDFSALTGAETITLTSFENLTDGATKADWGTITGNGGARIEAAFTDTTSGSNVVGTATDGEGIVVSGVETLVVTNVSDDTNVAIVHLCEDSADVNVVGIQGLATDTVTFTDAAWDVSGLIEAGADPKTGLLSAGTLVVDYEADTSSQGANNADASVTINNQGMATTKEIFVDGITVTNSSALAINAEDADVTISALTTNAVETLTVTSANDVTITPALIDAVETIDASGVAGDFTATTAHAGGDDVFTFTGSAGTTELTMNTTATLEEGSSFTSAGTLNLTVDNGAASAITVNLVDADVSGIASVFVGDGDNVTMTIAQSQAIGEANITTDATDSGTLTLVGLGEDAFSLANYDANLVSAGISLAVVDADGDGTVTLHADTDLTGVTDLIVPEGVTLNLTAAQVQQMLTFDGSNDVLNTPEITGVDSTGATSTDITVNITDMMQADADLGFDITDIDADVINITLAESVAFPENASSTATTNQVVTSLDPDNMLTINLADDMTLTYGEDTDDLDGVAIVGGTNTTVILQDANDGAGIDASGFDIDELHILDDYLVNTNIDEEFQGLSERVTKVIYFNEGDVSAQDQTVTFQATGTFSGNLEINRIEDDVEIQDLTVNMLGGVILDGDLILDSTDKNDGADLLHSHLDSLTINSSGTEENAIAGGTSNVITGSITSQSNDDNPSDANDATDNNLLTVNIDATQALDVQGNILFESVTGDDAFTLNDVDNATATLTVTGDSDVSVGSVSNAGAVSGVNTTDTDVDALNVVNNSTGTLSLVVNGTMFDADDALSFTGTGAIALQAVGTAIDLSDADLSAVTTITVGNGTGNTSEADGADVNGEVTLSQTQFTAVTLVDGSDDSDTLQTVNLVDFDGSVAFDATTITEGLTVGTITMIDADNVLDAATDLTGVTEIKVAEGTTLSMTAEQFQQLAGAGTITAYDANGDSTTDSITVNITDLRQDDVWVDADGDGEQDAGENLSFANVVVGAEGAINLSLAESVTLGSFDDEGLSSQALDADATTVLNGANIVLADGQDVELVTSTQADGTTITGTGTTTVTFRFSELDAAQVDVNDVPSIDVSGYTVTELHTLNTMYNTANAADDGEQNVESILSNLASSVELVIAHDPLALGLVDARMRVVTIEEGVEVDGDLVFNDIQNDVEVTTLTINFEGGASIAGDLSIPTVAAGAGLTAANFGTLTLNSNGSSDNIITGDITAAPNDLPTTATTIENSLQNVVINAEQDIVIGTYNDDGQWQSGGDIVFTALENSGTANLTVEGTADVTMHGVDTTDDDVNTGTDTPDITTLNITNNAGTLTMTGGSEAFASEGTETINFSGTGAVVLGSDDQDLNNAATGEDGDGFDSTTLSAINATNLSGDFTADTLLNIDVLSFTFTAGTGVTTLTLSEDTMGSTNNDLANAWAFNLATAAAGSEMRIEDTITFADASGDAETTNSLTIDNGAHTLFIDADQDFTNLDSLSITGPIVLTAGVDIILTAAQANELNIVADPSIILDTDDADYVAADVPTVTITDLGDAEYNFSNILAGSSSNAATVTATLEDDDVTVHANTDLGDATIALVDVADAVNPVLDNELIGQTIRFSTEEQAARTITVPAGIAGDASTNVVWLFDAITNAPINTDGYSSDIARLWFNQTLANGADIEDMFTSLPDAILRVDFADLTDLDDQLTSVAVDRTIELASFTDLSSGFVINDGDVIEHVQSLTINMGGEVTVGDIDLGNVIDNTATYTADTSFTTLTINSVLADDSGDLLAREDFDEEVNVKPTSGNTVGDITVDSTDVNIDLTQVVLNTGVDEATNDTTADDGDTDGDGDVENAAVNVLTGTSLTVGTITFDSEVLGTIAELELNGANDVTVASIDATDSEVTTVLIDNNNTGTVNVPGASPAGALNSTATLLIDASADSSLTMGTAGDATKPGISSDTLTSIIVNDNTNANIDNGDVDAYVNLGVIDSVNSDNFTIDSGIGIANAAVEFDYSASVGGAAPVDGDVISVTVNGTTYSYTVEGNAMTADAVVQALRDVINEEAADVTAAVDAGADTLTITANAGGDIETVATSYNEAGLPTADGIELVWDADEDGEIDSYTAPTGTVANIDGATLNDDGVWTFDNVVLNIGAATTLGAGELDLTATILTIDDNVDMTDVTLDFHGVGNSIVVTEGNTLTVTLEQVMDAGMPNITGSGTVKVINGLDANDDAIDAGEYSAAAFDANDIGEHLRTANVDLSELTIDSTDGDDTDDTIEVTLEGSQTTNGQNVATTYIGSANDEVVTAVDVDGLIVEGTAGDDTYVIADVATPGAEESNEETDTITVTSGTDTITGLHAVAPQDPIDPADEADVLIVNAGATANATTVDDFYASADTVNNGTASITTVASNGANPTDDVAVTLDMSEVTAGNGFNLTGDDVTYGNDGTDGGQVAMTIVGSSGDDVINGGDESQDADGVDELTGGAGDDIFVFNISQSTPAPLTVENNTTDGEDYELWDSQQADFAANVADSSQAITVLFSNNDSTTSFTVLDDATIDFTSHDEIWTRIATELTSRGVASAYDAAAEELTLAGTAGQYVELISITPSAAWDVGTPAEVTGGSGAGLDDSDDVAQETDVTVGVGAAADNETENGEIYSITYDPSDGGASITFEYTADGTETNTELANELATGLNGLAGVDYDFGVSNTDNVITIVDDVLDEDNGGFTVTVDNNPGVDGTGASALGAAGASGYTTADTITDFVSGDDKIQLNVAGDNSNYAEGAEEADYADALATAQTELDGNVLYYLTSTADLDGAATAAEDASGLLFFDANGNGNVDGVILLTGITEDNFDETDIIA